MPTVHTFDTTGAHSLTIPANGTVDIQCWGGGAGGNASPGGGGGGGEYRAESGVAVVASQVLSITVGDGGALGVNGGASSVDATCLANGGLTSTGLPGGLGGTGGTGATGYLGGQGGNGVTGGRGIAQGGGGSSAGTAANGVQPTTPGAGGIAPTGGGNGGRSTTGPDGDGQQPGGGGHCKRSGGVGKVIITIN